MADPALIDTAIQQAGGLEKALAMAEAGEQNYRQQLQAHEQGGDSAGADQLKQIMLQNEGVIDIIRCRMTSTNSAQQNAADGPADQGSGSLSSSRQPSTSSPKLIDPESFAALGGGSNPVDKGIQDLLGDGGNNTGGAVNADRAGPGGAGQSSAGDATTGASSPCNDCNAASGTQVQVSASESDADLKAKIRVSDLDLAEAAVEFMKTARLKWKSAEKAIDTFEKVSEPLDRAIDALDMADTAFGGEIPTTLKPIAQLSAFATKEQKVLDPLYARSTYDWIRDSGVNYQDRSTIAPAQAYSDNWSQQLSTIQQSLQAFLPAARTVQAFLADPRVIELRMPVAETTAVGLDGDALQDAISDLNNTSFQIGVVQKRLKEARAVVY